MSRSRPALCAVPHAAHRLAACAAACLAACAPAAAADEAPVVVVTAARQLQALTDAQPHTTVLTREDIERSQVIDLAALLAGEAGVQFASNGGRGTATTLFVRGAPTRQVLVLVDGVPLARQDATGQVGIEHLMLDQVERIEIVRGNVSALYGAGAVGGVIQVFTRTAGGAPRAAALLEVGSRGLRHGSASTAGSSGGTSWSVALSDSRDDGISALDPQVYSAANPDADGYRNRSATLRLAQQLAAGHAVSLGLWHSDGRLDYDSAYASAADTQTSRTRKNLVQLGSDHALSQGWNAQLRLSHQSDDARYDETGAYGSHSRYRTTADLLGWSNEWQLAGGSRLRAGLEHQRQRIASDDGYGDLFDHARTLDAAFASLQTRWAGHELEAALRRDDIEGTGGHWSGRLGWARALDAQWKLFASLANAFAAPPLGYLYAPYYGNAALKPERARTVEAGAQWSRGGQRLRATLFRSRVTDELDYDTTSFRFENVARTRNQGLELSYAGRLGATDLRASLTAQHPVDDLTGARRLRRSDTLASVSASHDLGQGARVGLAARYAGARPDSGNVTLPAYLIADLSAQWALARGWQLQGRLENLGDVHYQTANGYPQPGRGVFVGLRWNGAL